MNKLQIKGGLLFTTGKIQILLGKFLHNDIYIIRGMYKKSVGKILITHHRK